MDIKELSELISNNLPIGYDEAESLVEAISKQYFSPKLNYGMYLVASNREIELLKKENHLLKKLCIDQYKTMELVHRVNQQTLVSELKKSDEERDDILIDLVGGTCDCLSDPSSKNKEIISKLKDKYGINFYSRGE